MKLAVSSKNEYFFYPDIMDNLEKETNDRFTIIIRKLNQVLTGTEWLKFNKQGAYTGINNEVKIRDHVKEIINAPMLTIDGGEERPLTLDDLLGDEFPALFDVTRGLNDFILKLETEGVETKKL